MLQIPIDLANRSIVRSGRVAKEGLGLTKDIMIMTEGVLSLIFEMAVPRGPDLSASDVAADPFATSWDEVVRAPRAQSHQPTAGLDAPDNRPAA